MDLWGKGGVPLSLERVERERERDMKERGHAIPRLPAVPEVNAGDAVLDGPVFRHPDMCECLKTSTIASLMFFLQIRLHSYSRYDVVNCLYYSYLVI